MSKTIFKFILLLSFLCATSVSLLASVQPEKFKYDLPAVILTRVPFTMTITALTADGNVDTSFTGSIAIQGIEQKFGKEIKRLDSAGPFVAGIYELTDTIIRHAGQSDITIGKQSPVRVRVIPGILSLLPPILAIVLALTLREVLLALFSGVWLGAIMLHNYNPISGLLRALDTYLINALNDPTHVAIIMFSLTLGGMVGVISKSGGTQGIVAKISRWANHPRGGQIATWLMGVVIFFDDYANTLIVGNTMRPFTDKLRISREKLSYIVDSTAAPVASIAIISSWVGFQIGLIEQAFKNIDVTRDAYLTFIMSVPYASYSVLAIIFVFLVGLTLRDFATMYTAEHRSFLTGKVLRDNARPLADDKSLDIQAEEGTPLRWYNAAIPILVVIFATIFGLYYNGRIELINKGVDLATVHLGVIIGAADSFHVLMWASFLGAAVAIILAVSQRILTIQKSLDAWLNGVKAMIIAMIILILAWAIGNVCGELKTADFVIAATRDILSPHLLPVLTFVVAAFIGFSTGTSWATMAILVPIVIPMAFKLTADAQLSAAVAQPILLGTIGAVLSGSVFGDHCSPISDTTIMSSMTSAADHIDHVRTQLPYALTVAAVACLTGYLPAGFGFPVPLSILIGIAVLLILLFTIGKRITTRDQMMG